jgi:hypothetical protein
MGVAQFPTHPIDQRFDDGHSLRFDSLPFIEPYGNIDSKVSTMKLIVGFSILELFGFPTVQLNLSSNKPNGLICIRLNMIDEQTSASILLARGRLNLTHYKSHEHPEELNIDQIYAFVFSPLVG